MTHLRLYEPPLDTGDGDDDEPEIPPETRHPAVECPLATALTCLVIGAALAALIWTVAEWLVP